MKILITGATGFIGRHLVRELSQSEHDIYCIVRDSKKFGILKPFGVNMIHEDINDIHDSDIAVDFDVVFHCAGYVKNDSRERLYRSNVLATEHICEFALKRGIRRMVYLSSVAVVSGNVEVPLVEDLKYKATNIYGDSKIEAEKLVKGYRRKGLKSVILRPCAVYGEDEPHLLKLLLTALKLRCAPLVDNGGNRFHLVYIGNVVHALVFSISNDSMLEGEYFIADKEIMTAKEVFCIMAQAIGAKRPIELPGFLNPLFLKIPFVNRKIESLMKDRVYSTEKIESLGFKFPFDARTSLIRSCQALMGRG